ncbi:MAG: PAS domain S-box protein [Acidobacteria bacterium]|nr:PAS domain S-box protein [Acidobacteriota bacterium]
MGLQPTRVLLIEDEEADYLRTRRMLSCVEGQEFDLEWASSFKAGLEGIRRNAHDVYLIDYRLDGDDGLTLLGECRRTGNDAPVIILTGMTDYRLDMEAMRLGAADFLVKDEITPALLERSIRYAVAQASSYKELQKQQAELRASELRFRSVVQSAAEAIVIADGDGRIVSWNKGAETAFGYNDDEVLGYPLELLMPERYREAYRLGLERFRLTGKSTIVGKTIEVEGLRKDGMDFPIELSLGSWRTAEGTYFTAIIRDATERKRAEDARRAKETAEEANRAKTDFIARFSHEVRTPLTAIIGFTNLLLENRTGDINGQTRDFVERIMANAKDLLHLINGLLDVSKIEAGKLDVEICPVALDAVVHEVVRQLEGPRHNGKVRIDVELPDRMAPISTDAAKLKQVLINLVENALKFTEKGSVAIRVKTGPLDVVPVRIEISDTGPGIAAEEVERIFEPFHQAEAARDPRYAGTGLGLSICRSLCELLGYTLEVQSRPGAGSTFTIGLLRTDRLPPGTTVASRNHCAAVRLHPSESFWPHDKP